MIDNPISRSELIKIAKNLRVGDIISLNRGGNSFEDMVVTEIYPHHVLLENPAGKKECLRWSEVAVKHRQRRIKTKPS